ncbi:MAG: ribosome small subunit-dependent GTPase A [Bacteroidales bacterium]|nr:ribosome small subunit-dependent GTPase A [Bacteroidales bacterium]
MYGEGSIAECTIRGKFRALELKITNPVAVGDNVLFEFEGKGSSGVITEVLERKNYILRKASNLSREAQIIAANIDHAFLMITLKMPETPREFIDRFLVTAEAYRVPASLIINKTDLYGENELEKMNQITGVYRSIGYECITASLTNGTGVDVLRDKMKGKISLLAGNSGVGKTSLLNIFDPSLKLKTGEISSYHKQGRHITTFPEMHRMPFGGFVIDSPGIRGFGVVDMEKNEIYHFFPEIFRTAAGCRFYNCLHLDEPGCEVRKAVEGGQIDQLRYRSYVNILWDENSKYR